jgi:hypothetical protein
MKRKTRKAILIWEYLVEYRHKETPKGTEEIQLYLYLKRKSREDTQAPSSVLASEQLAK